MPKSNTKIKPVSNLCPRDGWSEQFRKMAENGDDKLLDEFIFEEVDLVNVMSEVENSEMVSQQKVIMILRK